MAENRKIYRDAETGCDGGPDTDMKDFVRGNSETGHNDGPDADMKDFVRGNSETGHNDGPDADTKDSVCGDSRANAAAEYDAVTSADTKVSVRGDADADAGAGRTAIPAAADGRSAERAERLARYAASFPDLDTTIRDVIAQLRSFGIPDEDILKASQMTPEEFSSYIN